MPFLIDGHNLIGAMPDLSLDDPDDEVRLVERLQCLALRTGRQITVIFDQGAIGGVSPSLSRGSVTVRFAPRGTTADALLIRQIQIERNPRGLIVVSSDRSVREAARRRGAQVWSASEFLMYMGRHLKGSPRSPTAEEDKPERMHELELENWLRWFQGEDA